MNYFDRIKAAIVAAKSASSDADGRVSLKELFTMIYSFLVPFFLLAPKRLKGDIFKLVHSFVGGSYSGTYSPLFGVYYHTNGEGNPVAEILPNSSGENYFTINNWFSSSPITPKQVSINGITFVLDSTDDLQGRIVHIPMYGGVVNYRISLLLTVINGSKAYHGIKITRLDLDPFFANNIPADPSNFLATDRLVIEMFYEKPFHILEPYMSAALETDADTAINVLVAQSMPYYNGDSVIGGGNL